MFLDCRTVRHGSFCTRNCDASRRSRNGAGLAKRAEAFGLTVSWWGPRKKPGSAWPLAASQARGAGESRLCSTSLANRSRALAASRDAGPGLVGRRTYRLPGGVPIREYRLPIS